MTADTLPRIDHIIIAAKDVRVAAKHFLDTYGLASYEGGKHQGGWGTENVIIPLGQGYLEIAAVFDPVAAQTCDWGKLIQAEGQKVTDEQPWKLVTFCVQSAQDAADVSNRNNGMLGHMLRLRPDGSKLTWRVACMSKFDAPGRAPKPFFITWDDPTIRPDKLAAQHKVQPSGFEFVELAGDEAAIKEWIGEGADTLPLRYVSGPPALKAVGIKTADGLVTLT